MNQDFERELVQLDSALETTDPSAAETYFGVRLMRDSLLRRRDLLIGEAAGVLDVVLSGDTPGVVGDEISLVARVLNSLQETLASIAQVLEGEPTSRGIIPVAIKDEVALRLAATAPGSLQLKLVPAHPVSAEDQAVQMALDADTSDEPDEAAVPLVDRSVEHLIGLLRYDPEDTDLLQDLAYVGPRTSTHLEELAKTLSESGANISLAWNSPYVTHETSFSRSASVALARKLAEVQEESREIVVTGRLVGGSLLRRRFELESSEDQGILAGEAAEDALQSLALLFGQNCTATIEVQTATLPSGETREAHFLKSLSS
jgi:hypothetical protein